MSRHKLWRSISSVKTVHVFTPEPCTITYVGYGYLVHPVIILMTYTIAAVRSK